MGRFGQPLGDPADYTVVFPAKSRGWCEEAADAALQRGRATGDDGLIHPPTYWYLFYAKVTKKPAAETATPMSDNYARQMGVMQVMKCVICFQDKKAKNVTNLRSHIIHLANSDPEHAKAARWVKAQQAEWAASHHVDLASLNKRPRPGTDSTREPTTTTASARKAARRGQAAATGGAGAGAGAGAARRPATGGWAARGPLGTVMQQLVDGNNKALLQRATHAFVISVARSGVAFNMLDTDNFAGLFHIFGFKPPSSVRMTDTLLPELRFELAGYLKAMLSTAMAVSLTSDGMCREHTQREPVSFVVLL